MSSVVGWIHLKKLNIEEISRGRNLQNVPIMIIGKIGLALSDFLSTGEAASVET